MCRLGSASTGHSADGCLSDHGTLVCGLDCVRFELRSHSELNDSHTQRHIYALRMSRTESRLRSGDLSGVVLVVGWVGEVDCCCWVGIFAGGFGLDGGEVEAALISDQGLGLVEDRSPPRRQEIPQPPDVQEDLPRLRSHRHVRAIHDRGTALPLHQLATSRSDSRRT